MENEKTSKIEENLQNFFDQFEVSEGITEKEKQRQTMLNLQKSYMSSEEYKKTYNKCVKTINIDLDGTILRPDLQIKFPDFSTPYPEAIECMQYMRKQGLFVQINTARVSECWDVPLEFQRSEVERFLQQNKIPYDLIWDKRGKPYTAWTIDDQAGFIASSESWRKLQRCLEIYYSGVNENGCYYRSKKIINEYGNEVTVDLTIEEWFSMTSQYFLR